MWKVSPLSNALVTAPGLPMHLVSAFLLLWTCWGTSGPPSLDSLYVVVWWVGLIGVWLIRGVLRVLMGFRHRSRAGSAQWLHWSIEPLLCASAAALIYSGGHPPRPSALLHVRFDISRPAMDRLAQQALATSDDSPLTGGRAGLYWVEKVRCLRVDPAKPEVFIYLIGYEGYFMYSPNPQPFVTDLGGGWYALPHHLT
jgi:hypothetical protein